MLLHSSQVTWCVFRRCDLWGMENGEEKIGGIWNSGVVWFGGRGEGGGSDFGGAWIISPWAHHFGGVLF